MLADLTIDFALKIVLALLLGGLIGFQREMAHKPAGLRTHLLIVLGATTVMETSHYVGSMLNADPTRIASNIIVGIGFIGAGTIMKEGPSVYGLTTAATIWVAGALGLAIGAGQYGASLLLTLSTLLVLGLFGRLESLTGKKHVIRRYQVIALDSDRVVDRIQSALGKHPKRRGSIDFRREGERTLFFFELGDLTAGHDSLFHDLRSMKEVIEVRSL